MNSRLIIHIESPVVQVVSIHEKSFENNFISQNVAMANLVDFFEAGLGSFQYDSSLHSFHDFGVF